MTHFQYKGSDLHRALTAGVAPRKIIYSGVGKKDYGIGFIDGVL